MSKTRNAVSQVLGLVGDVVKLGVAAAGTGVRFAGEGARRLREPLRQATDRLEGVAVPAAEPQAPDAVDEVGSKASD